MHGRVKVKSTAQQEAERKAEREAKLAKYREAMKAIFNHRHDLEKANDVLRTAAVVLSGNPDITTLWNIRKELIPKILTEDNAEAVFKREMDVSRQCLMSNPKSYGAWHHRHWCLEQMDDPETWKKELILCDQYLTADERNFHCWDHRNFVVSKSNVDPEDELTFTTDKINVNFSNYSAWHLRSKLLPISHPGSEPGFLDESVRRAELDLVQNAAFTDPEDSSAWFYHKWLLSINDSEAEAETEIVAVKIVNGEIFIAFSKPVLSKEISVENFSDLNWIGIDESTKMSKLWRAKISNHLDFLTIKFKNREIELKDGEFSARRKSRLKKLSDESTKEVLEQDLRNCLDLLELEPDSKWTRLSLIQVMRTLDEEKFAERILSNLDKLQIVDAKRKGYYRDLASKLRLQRALLPNEDGLESPALDLSGMNLTRIVDEERFLTVKKLNLSGNELKSVRNLLPFLCSCQELILDDNCLNQFELKDQLSFKTISLIGNPVNFTDHDEKKWPDIEFITKTPIK